MNEMNKTIIEKYEKGGYESAKKSFMDLVNADRSDDEKDDVILSYITMAKLAFVNKDNEMAEKLLRLDSKFDEAAEKKQLASKVAKKPVTARRSKAEKSQLASKIAKKPVTARRGKAEKSQLDSKADEPRDKPGEDNSANVKNVLDMEFVELYSGVYVSKQAVSSGDLINAGIHVSDLYYPNLWSECSTVCAELSNMSNIYNYRLPTLEDFAIIRGAYKRNEIEMESGIYYWTSVEEKNEWSQILHVAITRDILIKKLVGGSDDCALLVIREPKH